MFLMVGLKYILDIMKKRKFGGPQGHKLKLTPDIFELIIKSKKKEKSLRQFLRNLVGG